MRRSLVPSLVASLLLPCLPGIGSEARATTYVPVADAVLSDQAVLIVEARVAAVRHSPPLDSAAEATDYEFEVVEFVKGASPQDRLIVRVAGASAIAHEAGRSDRLRVHLWGAPQFRRGDSALLFLTPRPDGTHAILHWMLGAFHQVDIEGRRFAVRSLDEAHAVTPPSWNEAQRLAAERDIEPRDFDRFKAWLVDRAQGIERDADYFAPAVEGRRPTREFSYLGGRRLRWFQFDTAQSVPWRAHTGGQPGLSGGGFSEIQTALAAWNADGPSNILYTYGGTTASTNGLTTFDNVNSVLFNRSLAAFGVDPFDCATGGVLAIGGPWFSTSTTKVFKGVTYIVIQAADIITNLNISCFFTAGVPPDAELATKAAAELFAHELGHTLGFGHSCGDSSTPACGSSAKLDDALMRAFIHDDNRGARLGADEKAAVLLVYPGSGGGGKPAAPTQLTFTLQANRNVQLKLKDNSNNETNFKVYRKIGSGAFALVKTVGANTTTIVVSGQQAGKTYTFNVKATNAAGASAASNNVVVVVP